MLQRDVGRASPCSAGSICATRRPRPSESARPVALETARRIEPGAGGKRQTVSDKLSFMARRHQYETETVWTGDRGRGTADYRAYDRRYDTTSPDRPPIRGSSDPAFRGDPERWNPELLLVAALSQCHLLWYLHCCAVNDVSVTGYSDTAVGVMVETPDGGRFEEVVLRPVVTVAGAEMVDRAEAMHREASQRCFIASSMNFPVRHEPRVLVAEAPTAAV